MDWINQVASRLFDVYVALFGGAPRWVSLSPLSVVAGVVTLWVFGLASKPNSIRAAKRLLVAYLLEMRLYGDEPAMVLRAQWRLLGANVRYLGLMLVPLLCAGILLTPLLAQMERFYGRGPLQPARAALFTVQLRGPGDWNGEP